MAPETVIVIAACYASLLFEIAVLRVPSVASSLRMLVPREEILAGYSQRFRRLFELGTAAKLLICVAPLVIVYAVFLYPWIVIAAGRNPFGDNLFAPSRATDFVAVLGMVCGRALALAAAVTVRRENRQRGGSFRLHTGGVFKWSRNPGLVGMYMFAAGLWAAAPSASMLAGIGCYFLYMHFKVTMEEDFLANRFGTPYLEYRRRTSRYLP